MGLVSSSVPRTHGVDAAVHVSALEALVDGEAWRVHATAGAPPATAAGAERAAVDAAIAARVAALIGDGDTVQVGIGGLPDMVLGLLRRRRGLRVHSEMISDGVQALVEAGSVAGVVTASFAYGSRALYRWLDGNAGVVFRDAGVVNDPCKLRDMQRLVSVNSACEVDLTGQVCSDSVGTRIYSGVGGSLDFVQGATGSPGGRSIIALPSRTAAGAPRIAACLRPGAGVTVPRAAVQWVITEHGAANLAGATLRERARMLLDIAHPDDRAALERDAHAAGVAL